MTNKPSLKAMKFKVEIETPSQNDWDDWHFHKQSQFKKECKKAVKVALGPYEYTSTPPHKFHFHRVAKRRIDLLNIPSGMKGILDGFVDCNVIEDDSFKYVVKVTFSQALCKKGELPYVLVTVT